MNNSEDIKALRYWPFFLLVTDGFPYNVPAMLITFPCHHIIMSHHLRVVLGHVMNLTLICGFTALKPINVEGS